MDKMYFISSDQYLPRAQSSRNPYTQKLNDLENELKRVANNELMNEHEKVIKYSQLLQTYLKFKEQERLSRKLKLEIVQPDQESSVPTDGVPPEDAFLYPHEEEVPPKLEVPPPAKDEVPPVLIPQGAVGPIAETPK